MVLKKGYKALLDEVLAQIETVPAAQAIAAHGDPDVVVVDLRDPRELQREGIIPGTFHALRGMIEFWVDPESPYHQSIFASRKRFLLFCAAGWRSALTAKTLTRIGLDRVAHIDGGFTTWKAQGGGGPIEQKSRRTKT